MGEEHRIRAGRTSRENLMPELLKQPEEPGVGASLTEPHVEQSVAQVKWVRH